MNRREFLRRSALAALMATPAGRAMALLRDFGVPGEVVATGEGLVLPSGRRIERVAFLASEFGALDGFSPCLNLDCPGEIVPIDHNHYIETLSVERGPFCYPSGTTTLLVVDESSDTQFREAGE